MGRVMRNHRRAAYADPKDEYEELTVTPMTHAPTLFTQETWALARKTWDERTRDRRGCRLPQCASHRHRADRMLVGDSMVIDGSRAHAPQPPRQRGRRQMAGRRLPRADRRRRTAGDEVLHQRRRTDAPDHDRERLSSSKERRRTASRSSIRRPATFAGSASPTITPEDVVALSMGALARTPRTVALPPLGEEYWTADYTTRVPRTVTAELAELVGYFMGDGSLARQGLALLRRAGRPRRPRTPVGSHSVAVRYRTDRHAEGRVRRGRGPLRCADALVGGVRFRKAATDAKTIAARATFRACRTRCSRRTTRRSMARSSAVCSRPTAPSRTARLAGRR